MTATSTIAPVAHIPTQNAFAGKIGHIASLLQTKLYEAEYLIDSIDKSTDDAESADDVATRVRALDKVLVFCRLVQASVTEARALAENIEAECIQAERKG